MAIYAIVNKETKVVTNTILWQGDSITIPATEVWVQVPEDTVILINKTLRIDGQIQEPIE